jgi:dihydrofolate synthase/folylpolyglutamate synthase
VKELRVNRDLNASLEKLYALRTFGIKPGLDPIRGLLTGLGEPHLGFAAVHIAGTNGKGSVAAMLDSVLRAAGFRVGLYTSPHLVRFNERIRVGGEAVSDDVLADLFDRVAPVAADLARRGVQPTFFEYTTAMAFEHFRRERVQIAVVETGLGGRLDATNVVLPLISVITRVGLDHMVYLGDTVEAIAGEKAGIIKEGRPVVCGAMPEAAREVVRSTALDRHAPFVDAAEAVAVRRVSQSLAGQKVHIGTENADYGTVLLRLLGRHQLENVATVMAVVEALAGAGGLAVAPAAVKAGLAAARWPGRLDVLSEAPPVILDGAHNPDAARVLAASLKELFRHRPVALVWGMCSDKDALGFSAELGAVVRVCWPVALATERTRTQAELANIARSRGWEVRPADLAGALAAAERWAQEQDGVVCIAGSLYLAGEVLALRQGTTSMPI